MLSRSHILSIYVITYLFSLLKFVLNCVISFGVVICVFCSDFWCNIFVSNFIFKLVTNGRNLVIFLVAQTLVANVNDQFTIVINLEIILVTNKF